MEAGPPAAALPRALDVQRFAGAREQEIRALVGALQQGPLGPKFGVAALPRHLRRRAGSHKPFHGHRFRPNAKLQGKRLKLQTAGVVAAAEGAAGKAAPGTVEGNAAGGEGEPGLEATAGGSAVAARPFTNRRMRRTPAALAEQNRHSAAWIEAPLAVPAPSAAEAEAIGASSGNSGRAGSSGGSRLRRLETHVWHAKRLAMEERYGWLLPAGAAGQGRGSRSFVHVAKASCLMHDASYHCPLLLSGTWDAVHSLLGEMLPPEEAASLAGDWQASSGINAGSSGSSGGGWGWEQEVLLHHPVRYPAGAICPARLLLLPCAGGSSGGSRGVGAPQAMDAEGPGSSAAAAAAPAPAPAPGVPASAEVQACLWVHPAAAAEAHAALRSAVERQQQGSGPDGVSLAVVDLRRLELRGGTADAALAVALAGATAGGVQQQLAQQRFDGQQQAQQGQQGQEKGRGLAAPGLPLPPPLAWMEHGDAVQVLLRDPRLQKPVQLGSAAGTLLPGNPAAGEQGEQAGPALEEQPADLTCLPHAPLPLSEAEVSSRRQQLRRRMLQLEPLAAPSNAAGGASAAATGRLGDAAATGRLGDAEVQARGCCPAVLVRHNPPGDTGIPGWSLILPPGWAPPLWLALAYAGCKPAGQREWRWLHALEQRRCFPWDCPDTAGYAALMRQQAQLRRAAQARRPKGKQMLAAPPPPPPWEQLLPQPEHSGQAALGAAHQQPLRHQGQLEAEQAMDVDAPGMTVLGARQLRRRQREQEDQRAALLEMGGDPAELEGLESAGLNSSGGSSGSSVGEVAEEQVQVVGWVLSEAPRGMPRRCGALAAVSAAAAWRLRSLQHRGAATGGGGILAFVRNPSSAALLPVRLQLAVEQGPA
ncbi:hypothetical protein ABPG75_000716 [Micractinium tetrahymenae]